MRRTVRLDGWQRIEPVQRRAWLPNAAREAFLLGLNSKNPARIMLRFKAVHTRRGSRARRATAQHRACLRDAIRRHGAQPQAANIDGSSGSRSSRRHARATFAACPQAWTSDQASAAIAAGAARIEKRAPVRVDDLLPQQCRLWRRPATAFRHPSPRPRTHCSHSVVEPRLIGRDGRVGHAVRPDADCSASNALQQRARSKAAIGCDGDGAVSERARIARFTPAMVSER